MSTVHTGEPTAIGAGDRTLAAGDVVGEYVIETELGKGGFGTVYLARHPLIGKQAAIKVLSRRYSSDETVVSRFVDEARAVNQIRHRNIVDIFSFGQLGDGRHYYTMEYLEGTPLDRYLAEHGALTLDRALPILRAIARALDAAHAKGIAHRDLKPENIVLTFDDEGQIFPKLLDFGIAKLTTPEQEQAHRTGTGVPLGTPFYMSPEQCRGRDVDHRTDIYSFGVLTFRLLTGDYPFHGELIEILHKHMHDEPPAASSINPALAPATDRAIRQMMAKEAADRPPSVIGAVVALQGEGGAQITPSAIRSLPPMTARDAVSDTLAAPPTVDGAPVARSRALWLAGAAVAVAALALIAWTTLRGTEPSTSPPDPARAPIVAPVVAPVVAPAPPQPPPTAVAPAVPKRAIVTLEGAPAGAAVSLAGVEIGYVPSVELAYGTSAVVVTLALEDYYPLPIKVTPDRDQTLPAVMKKKPRVVKRNSKDDILPWPKDK